MQTKIFETMLRVSAHEAARPAHFSHSWMVFQSPLRNFQTMTLVSSTT
jgi:hypothetical protein